MDNAVLRPVVTYGCETWNLTVRAQKRLLTFFENKVLRHILGPKRDLLTGPFRKRSNEETRTLTGQPLITALTAHSVSETVQTLGNVGGIIKSHRLRLAGHVARAPPTRYTRQVLDRRPNTHRHQSRLRLRWEDNVGAKADDIYLLALLADLFCVREPHCAAR